MFDKHVSKILLEAVQMLCTTIQLIDAENEVQHQIKLYKIAHKNHPVTIWMRTSLENYIWTLDLVDAMHDEWKFRYDHPPEKMHKSYIVAKFLREFAPSADKFPQVGLTPFALAMPVECKSDTPLKLIVNIIRRRINRKSPRGRSAVNPSGILLQRSRDFYYFRKISHKYIL